MSIQSELSSKVGDVFAGLGLNREFGEVVPSQRPELAQFQCNGALAAAKAAGRNPREIAQDVAAALAEDHELAEVSVAGPGFINLTVTGDYLAARTDAIALDPRLGVPTVAVPQKIIVDYAGPNVAKSMHVGHLRATIIGDSIKRTLRHTGHEALGDAHFGDWGLQMGMLIVAVQERFPDLPHFTDRPGPCDANLPITLDDLQEWYPQISAAAEQDETVAARAREATTKLQQGHPGYRALWEHFVNVSRASLERDFADLGVEFELWYGESTVHDLIEPMLARLQEQGLVHESDGALVMDVSEPGDKKEMTPLVLRTSHGAYLYGTTDLATILMRVEELHADAILYVVDARQAYHFEQVFRAARRSEIAPERVVLEHIRFGTMNDAHGKPFKTRAGGVLRLRDLIEMVTTAARHRLDESDLAQNYPEDERDGIARQVGLAALKFGDLINNRTSDYVFDLDRFTSFEGKTGPYLQFAAVRIQSVLRKASDAGFSPGTILPPATDAEESLVLALHQLPEIIARAVDLRAPNQIAEFAYELSQHFSRFYEKSHILSEPDDGRRSSWLRLVELTLNELRLLLDLLGIEVPERM